MKRSEVLSVLKDMGIRGSTISFYVDAEGNEQSDTSFGLCEISGERSDLAGCTALDVNGNIVHFEASTFLISGALGKIAGAF